MSSIRTISRRTLIQTDSLQHQKARITTDANIIYTTGVAVLSGTLLADAVIDKGMGIRTRDNAIVVEKIIVCPAA